MYCLSLKPIHTLIAQHQEQSVVECLAQGHLDTLEEAGIEPGTFTCLNDHFISGATPPSRVTVRKSDTSDRGSCMSGHIETLLD